MNRTTTRIALTAALLAVLGCRPSPEVEPATFREPGTSSRPAVREISFATADGGVVFADTYGSGSRGVVLAHGGRFDKSSWSGQAPQLADAGFRVVAIDFRGRGRSVGGSEPEGYDQDVLAAVRYLRESGSETVSVIGASFGGGAAAEAAAAAPGAIDCLVLLAHSPIENPERLGGRKLFILTKDDFRGEGTLRLPEIRDQFERAPEPKEMVLLDGSAHAQFIFDTDQGPRLMQEILRFLTAP